MTTCSETVQAAGYAASTSSSGSATADMQHLQLLHAGAAQMDRLRVIVDLWPPSAPASFKPKISVGVPPVPTLVPGGDLFVMDVKCLSLSLCLYQSKRDSIEGGISLSIGHAGKHSYSYIELTSVQTLLN